MNISVKNAGMFLKNSVGKEKINHFLNRGARKERNSQKDRL